jgi:hypothetical protein
MILLPCGKNPAKHALIMRMPVIRHCTIFIGIIFFISFSGCGKFTLVRNGSDLDSSKPWVFWYWMEAAVSREGITADLEAMKEAGIGGAYLMPIKGPSNPPLLDPPVTQLTPEWWSMVKHAMNEADRLGLKLGFHASDGFALAGGPWITPELSMQKVVWTETTIEGGRLFQDTLEQPETNVNYYRDIAVLAFPAQTGKPSTTRTIIPRVTTCVPDKDASFLVEENSKETFRSDDPCWITYAFEKPFTCRSITIRTNGNSYQAHRLIVKTSNDGNNFTIAERLEASRHGWQDADADVTHVIKPVTAKYFQFVYDKEGTEPGAEDLDAAKWKPSLKIKGIELSSAARIHQYEGKTGEVWRISKRTSKEQVPDNACVKKESILNITKHYSADGILNWEVPPGTWVILRIGHTSTGHTNYTGGGGLGLECDKFNPKAVRSQFNNWFGEIVKQAGAELASRVLNIFHVDSWECGSQNWSPVFLEEFKKRRGYDLFSYLPVMAGIPVESADVSERFLHDVRQTIAELVHDNFYGTMSALAHEKGSTFTAESVAPTMTSDGMLHYDLVDVPMGEFWLRSPTHDKPNDMQDAISGAHVYGKPIIQAEAFTTLRMAWDEHPGVLKAVGDRNYALGVNRMVYHVFTHNPWPDRRPGMTLDGVGLCFQRDQTWWKPGREWGAYAQRCQALLQKGKPVIDLAVFTGEETPRRAVLPHHLVTIIPGIFGEEKIKDEKARLNNSGQPLRELPDGVNHSANMADPEDWIDPLRGYAFDSFNKDALLRLTKVVNGRIELPGGASYAMLIIPGSRTMSPNGKLMTPEVASRLSELVEAGATILIQDEAPDRSPSLEEFPSCDTKLRAIVSTLWEGEFKNDASNILIKQAGKGRIVKSIYKASSFDAIGIARDFIARDSTGISAGDIAWTHRASAEEDIYFISNQKNANRIVEISLRAEGRVPELYDPVTDKIREASVWRFEHQRTILPVRLNPNGSVFIILRKPTRENESNVRKNWIDTKVIQTLNGEWKVKFDPRYSGPADAVHFDSLMDWTIRKEFGVRHYSGTAIYSKTIDWNSSSGNTTVWMDLGKVANIAEVYVNEISCGVAWTPPYRVDVTKALKNGKNDIRIEVTNTWANRLIGDHTLPENQRITWTRAPFRLQGKSLLEAGLLGPVPLCVEKK